MTRFIGQITVILSAADAGAARRRLEDMARVIEAANRDVGFAGHNGDVEDYDAAEAECDASLRTV